VLALDGNPVDMLTICVGVGACLIRPIRRRFHHSTRCFVFHDVITDFLNGTVIVPFALLVGATFSQQLLHEALHTNRAFFAIAGLVTLSFVIREYTSAD